MNILLFIFILLSEGKRFIIESVMDSLPTWLNATTTLHGIHTVIDLDKNHISRLIRWCKQKEITIYPVNVHKLYSRMLDMPSFTDPLFPRQWYLHNPKQGHDLNILPLWREGLTGKGIVISLIDDGIDFEHEDLKHAFRKDLSYDFNDHRKVPIPDKKNKDFHGTRCAGQLVSYPNNTICGVGIAPGAQISAIRILSDAISTEYESAAVIHHLHEIHIYSCSWGPKDDGMSIDAPEKLVLQSFIHGCVFGRNERGSIYVFAAGNGKSVDDCNYDGYANGIFSLTVGAIDINHESPRYMEPCAAQLITAYSSNDQYRIATTELGNRCTTRHGGTSASVPMVTGILALILEKRPDLHWNDIRKLMVYSAVPVNLPDDSWISTGAGLKYSNKFGFGKIDAGLLLQTLKSFSLNQSRDMAVRSLPFREFDDGHFTASDPFIDTFILDSTLMKRGNLVDIEQLQYITITLYIDHTYRGDLEIFLTSPSGTTIQFLTNRPLDKSKNGFRNWTIMTPAFWGESIQGKWTFQVNNRRGSTSKGVMRKYRISFWGDRLPVVVESKDQFAKLFLYAYYPPSNGHFDDHGGFWDSPHELDYDVDTFHGSTKKFEGRSTLDSLDSFPQSKLITVIIALIFALIVGFSLKRALIPSKNVASYKPL